MADPRILIVLLCFLFLPAASRGTEKVLEGGVLARHPSNIAVSDSYLFEISIPTVELHAVWAGIIFARQQLHAK